MLLAACGDETKPKLADSGPSDVMGPVDSSADAGGQTDTAPIPDSAPVDTWAVDAYTDSAESDIVADGSGEPDAPDGELQDTVDAGGVEDATFDTGPADDVEEPDVVETDTAQPLSLCEQYCILAELNCDGANKIDFGPQPCEAQCGTWPEGDPGDTLGNSVQCRLYHLGVAALDPETHCPHAAPDGGGVCTVPDYGNDAGDTCETSGVAVLSPGINAASTEGNTNSYTPGACGFTSGAAKDAAWTMTPPMSGTYTFTLASDQGGPSVVYVVEDCEDVSGTCLGFSNALVDEPLEATLIAGQTYFVIVDGWNAGQAGAFELEIQPPCVPFCAQFQECGDDGCGGSCGTCNPNDPNGWTTCDPGTNTCVTPQESQANTCSKAIPVYVLPFTFSGSTSGASNNYGYGPAACPGVDFHWGNGSKDHTFVIQPGQSAIYTIELEADFDATLYVVEDCTNIDGTCLAASETF